MILVQKEAKVEVEEEIVNQLLEEEEEERDVPLSLFRGRGEG